jgi:hypothetical protein
MDLKASLGACAGSLLLVNDDDFGIAGGRTQIVVVRGTGIARTQP